MRAHGKFAAAVAVLMAALTACSGGSSSNTAAPPPASTPTSSAATTNASPSATAAGLPSFNNHGSKTVSGSTVTLEADNFYFEPSVIQGKPGQKITVTVKNSGSTEHNFTVKAQNVNVDIASHTSKTATITIPMSGFVSFWCEYHQGKGMAGVLKPS